MMYSKFKKLTIVLLLLSFKFDLSAQNYVLYNASLKDTTQNELFWEWENELIVLQNYINEYLSIVINGKDTLPLIMGSVKITPNRNSVYKDVNTITLLNSKQQVLLEKVFICKRINDPVLIIGDMYKNVYTIEDLIQKPYLNIKILNNNIKNFDFELYSFKLSVMDAENTYPIQNIHTKGTMDTIPLINSYTNEITYTIVMNDKERTGDVFFNSAIGNSIIQQLKQLPNDAKLSIYDIEIIGPNGTTSAFESQILQRR
jgi:hypothetical protein